MAFCCVMEQGLPSVMKNESKKPICLLLSFFMTIYRPRLVCLCTDFVCAGFHLTDASS